MTWIFPVSGFSITQTYSVTHPGIDLGVPDNTSVVAADAGKIIYAGTWGTGGNTIAIDHGNGYVSQYMHLSRFSQGVGAHVLQGQQIGLSGHSGIVTGPHVHFEINTGKGMAGMSALTSVDPQLLITPEMSRNNGATARYPQGDALGTVPALANGKGINLNPLNALGLGGIASFLTTSSNWKRLGLGAIGASLLMIAAIELGSTNGAVSTLAKVVK